jgi:hypothetical protein
LNAIDLSRFRAWLLTSTADDRAPLTVYSSPLLGGLGVEAGEPDGLVVRVDHRECIRRGLGIRWDVIARFPATVTLAEAKAIIVTTTGQTKGGLCLTL